MLVTAVTNRLLNDVCSPSGVISRKSEFHIRVDQRSRQTYGRTDIRVTLMTRIFYFYFFRNFHLSFVWNFLVFRSNFLYFIFLDNGHTDLIRLLSVVVLFSKSLPIFPFFFSFPAKFSIVWMIARPILFFRGVRVALPCWFFSIFLVISCSWNYFLNFFTAFFLWIFNIFCHGNTVLIKLVN